MWMNPKFWLVLLTYSLFLIGAGYAWGHKDASNVCAAGQAKKQRQAQGTADKETTRREGVAAGRETSREQIRIVYRTIKEKAHETPVDAACGLDACGLRIWNAANAGAAPPVCGQPDDGMPRTAAGPLGQPGRPAGQPHRDGGAVQPVPGSDEKTAGVPGK